MTHDVDLKRLRWILAAAVVPAVVESITLLAVSWSWRHYRQDLVKPREQQLCLEHFGLENDNNEKKEHCQGYLEEEIKGKTKSTQCCRTMHEVFDGLAEKSLLKRYDSDTNPELTSLDLSGFDCIKSKYTPPFVRVVDIAVDKKPVRVGSWFKLFWNPPASSSTMSTFGLRYLTDDGTIYVEETDYYFVSSQLKTKRMKASAGNGVDATIRHSVHLISNRTEAVILENVQRDCKTTTQEAESTSVLGATFRLKYGDRLYVATSHPQNIAPDAHNSYFSIHRI